MHQIEAESKREYYEDMIRQAKITASAQSEDSGITAGCMTTGSGYSELVALRELDTPQGMRVICLTPVKLLDFCKM